MGVVTRSGKFWSCWRAFALHRHACLLALIWSFPFSCNGEPPPADPMQFPLVREIVHVTTGSRHGVLVRHHARESGEDAIYLQLPGRDRWEQIDLVPGIISGISLSPDETQIAYVESPRYKEAGELRLHVADIFSTTSLIRPKRVVARAALEFSSDCPLAWSPDGRRLAWVAGKRVGKRELRLVDMDRETSRTLSEATGHLGVRSVVWPTSESLVFSRIAEAGLFNLNPETGEVKRLHPGSFTGCLKLSPDRKLLSVSELEGDRGEVVRALNLEGREVTVP